MTNVSGTRVTVEDASIFATNVYLINDKEQVVTADIPLEYPKYWDKATNFKGTTELNPNGFAGQVYINKATNDYVISFRGTDDFLTDFPFQNFGMLTGVLARQNYSAQVFTDNAIRQIAANHNWSLDEARSHITFTGHSLGGGLANIMAAVFDRPAIVFDPAPTVRWADGIPVITLLAPSPLTIMNYYEHPDSMPPLTSPTDIGRMYELYFRAQANTSPFKLNDEVFA